MERDLLYTEFRDAIQNGNIVKIKELVSQGADVNHTGGGYDYYMGEIGGSLIPPMICAVNPMTRNRYLVIQTLLDIGADPNIESILVDGAQATLTPLINSAKFGDISAVILLVKNGANVNKSNSSGNTPLIVASQVDGNPSIEYLIQNGANINSRNIYGQSAILTAAYQNANRNLEILSKYKADINLRDNDGDTVLSVLQSRGNYFGLEILRHYYT